MAKKNDNAPAPAPVDAEAAMLAELQALRSQLATAQAAAARSLTFKVSEKGCLSVYGLGKFPTTLYAGQWRRLIAAVPAIEAFLRDNAERLKEK